MSDKWVKQERQPAKIKCGDCCHFLACAQWNVGNIAFMDATNCIHYDKSICVQMILPEINGKAHIALLPKSEVDGYITNCKICDGKGGDEDEI